MATIKPELKQILDKYGINPSDKSQIWDCHGTLVLYHKAFEIIAAKEGIAFAAPTVIEADSDKRTVALLVTGSMKDRTEWSIGEAAPGNNKNSYPYAMAEKRAKDRVIAKLVGLSAYVYSEDEADEFKNSPVPDKREAPPVNVPPRAEPPQGQAAPPSSSASPAVWQEYGKALLAAAQLADSTEDLARWQKEHAAGFRAIQEKSAKLHDWLAAGMSAQYSALSMKETL